MLIAGFDEVGRGCWAGPLVVGAALIDDELFLHHLKDSKLYSLKQRNELAPVIEKSVIDFLRIEVSAREIDSIGLGAALGLGFTNAYRGLSKRADRYVIDGNVNYLKLIEPKSINLIKADSSEQAVAAAALLAKVYRDNLLVSLATKYPDYGFERHVGYGTKQHKEALINYGLTSIHRRSFRPMRDML